MGSVQIYRSQCEFCFLEGFSTDKPFNATLFDCEWQVVCVKFFFCDSEIHLYKEQKMETVMRCALPCAVQQTFLSESSMPCDKQILAVWCFVSWVVEEIVIADLFKETSFYTDIIQSPVAECIAENIHSREIAPLNQNFLPRKWLVSIVQSRVNLSCHKWCKCFPSSSLVGGFLTVVDAVI